MLQAEKDDVGVVGRQKLAVIGRRRDAHSVVGIHLDEDAVQLGPFLFASSIRNVRCLPIRLNSPTLMAAPSAPELRSNLSPS